MFVLRDYQQAAVDALLNYYYTGNTGNPLIVLPTGTGKSAVLAALIQLILQMWPNQRILLLTHDKELVRQDAATIQKFWPHAPMGIYCAGLRRKESAQPIIVGSIGSVANKTELFGHRDLVFIDEAQRLSPSSETQYAKTLTALRKVNPNLKAIGLTATPFRMKQGLLTDGQGVFTDTCFDATTVEAFNWFIQQGYLAPVLPRPTDTTMPIGGVSVRGGEFAAGELEKAVDRDEITRAAMQEMVYMGANRKAWIVFTTGIDHAEHTAEILQEYGIAAAALHSKIKTKERDSLIQRFKAGELRCLVTKDMLTTGFDHPPIDLIGMLRPSMSPGLHVQMIGRGMRPCPGKQDCVVLDFAGNVPRLGPINAPRIPKKGKGDGTMPVRICDECGVYNHASARFCGGGASPDEGREMGGCGHEFTFEVKFTETAGDTPLMKSNEPVIVRYNVDQVWYHRHQKRERNDTMKVTYICGVKSFNEWVCLEHTGLPRKKAYDWWRQRHAMEPPTSTDTALAHSHELRRPIAIDVDTNRKYPEVVAYHWGQL